MSIPPRRVSRAAAVMSLALLALAVVTPLAAQAPAPTASAASIASAPSAASTASAPSSGEVVLSSELLKTGLYLIRGGGANSLLRLSGNGMILVDGKSAGQYRAVMSQVRKIARLSDQPVRVLVLTNHRDDRAGNAAEFLARGVAILAQQNARPRLPTDVRTDGKPPTPVVTYDTQYALHMGGVEVELTHVGRAKTDDDAVVHFPDMKIVGVGDLYTRDTPQPQWSEGGSLVGWASALDAVIALDFDTAVPSKGPPVTRADLLAFKGKLDTLLSRAKTLVKQGVAKDQLMARLASDDLGWRVDLHGPALDAFHAELSRAVSPP